MTPTTTPELELMPPASFAGAPGSASPSQHEDDWEDDDGQDHSCHFCGGEGWVFGDDLDDPLWYDRDAAYKCPCCHGSGDAKDCTFW